MMPTGALRPRRVAALAVSPSGAVALVERSDGAAGSSRRWELPTISLAAGESIEHGALRALQEQTGTRSQGCAVSLLGLVQLDPDRYADELALACVFLQHEINTEAALPGINALASLTWGEIRALILSSHIKDAAALSAFTLFHERHGAGQRPKSYELSASFFLRDLRGDYFNSWYPEALRLLNDSNLNLELSPDEPLRLTASGSAALTDDRIELIAYCLQDIGKHCVGRFWVTQIINGRESIDDWADPERALR